MRDSANTVSTGPPAIDIARLKARLGEASSPEDLAAISLALGVLYARLGDHDEALFHLSVARRHYASTGSRAEQAEIEVLTGVARAGKGEFARAVVAFERAATLARSEGDPALVGRIASEHGLVELTQGNTRAARALLEDAFAALGEKRSTAQLARLLRSRSLLALREDDLPEAARLGEQALQVAKRCGDPLEVGRALINQALIDHRRGDTLAALACYRSAIDGFTQHELPRDLAEACYRFGLFIGEVQDKLPEGVAEPPALWLARAQDLYRQFGNLADLERVRDGFLRFGRRGTDRVANGEVLALISDLKQSRLDVQRNTTKMVDRCRDSLTNVHDLAGSPLKTAAADALEELNRLDTSVATALAVMAASEDRILGVLNSVILQRENIRTLLELTRTLNQLGDAGQIAKETVHMVAQLTGADRVVLARRNRGGAVNLEASLRVGDGDADAWRPTVERAAAGGGAELLQRTAGPDRDQRQSRGAQAKLGFAMITPLRVRDKIIGAVYADKELSGGLFTQHDLDLLVIFCAQVATILENVRIADEMLVAVHMKEVALEAMTAGVISLDAEGRVSSLNSSAARLLGVSVDDAGPVSVRKLPDLEFLQMALMHGEELDDRVARVGSSEFLVNGHPVRGEGDRVIGFVATFTEMKRAQSLAQRIVGSTARFSFADAIGVSPGLRKQIQLAEAAARSDSNVLITGESGTGKELFAQAIHNAGPRASGPFVGINCAAIPRELLESELFGYEAGAFTGAKRGGHPGKFELAEGGTILLDEIGDMPLEMQAKLLRVLQERRGQRIGGTRDIRFDARVIATTNRDVTEDARRGRFRQDLLFRIKVIHVHLPALRERPEDVPLLVTRYLGLFSNRLGKKVRSVSPEVMRALTAYPWPGNVRELENVLESEANLAPSSATVLTHVPDAVRGEPPSSPVFDEVPPSSGSAPVLDVNAVSAAEREVLMAALTLHHGRIPDVARALGVSRGTVYNRLRRFLLDAREFRR